MQTRKKEPSKRPKVLPAFCLGAAVRCAHDNTYPSKFAAACNFAEVFGFHVSISRLRIRIPQISMELLVQVVTGAVTGVPCAYHAPAPSVEPTKVPHHNVVRHCTTAQLLSSISGVLVARLQCVWEGSPHHRIHAQLLVVAHKCGRRLVDQYHPWRGRRLSPRLVDSIEDQKCAMAALSGRVGYTRDRS